MVGYLAYGDDAANVLFHVVNERHLRRRSMIFTTNKPLDDWGRVLHDKDLAAAIVDTLRPHLDFLSDGVPLFTIAVLAARSYAEICAGLNEP